MTTIADTATAGQVVGGVDTHRDTHTVAAVTMTGQLLGHATFGASSAGYDDLLGWLRGHGNVVRVGVEGTGAYGAGLARHLDGAGVSMVEVDRPDRRSRRARGKTDPFDAEAAARAVLAGVATGQPKCRDGQVEALRNLRVARRSAVEQRADCMRQLKALIVTAPAGLRERLQPLTKAILLDTCAGLRPDTARVGDPVQAVKVALRSLARRHQQLTDEINDLERLINPLVATINPNLIALFGVGPDVAGQLLVTAGQNTHRLISEPGFAMLCGVAPIPASSGKTNRHRLNRGGDRQANSALHRIAISRLKHDPRTIAYYQRRTTEGLSKRDIIRCLKRLIAREIYYTLNPAKTIRNTA